MSMFRQDQEIVDLGEEEDTLLSHKMKKIKHVNTSSNCLSSISLGNATKLSSSASSTSIEQLTQPPQEKRTNQLHKSGKASNFAENQNNKPNRSVSVLKRSSNQPTDKRKAQPPRLFEIRKQCEGKRRIQLREIPITLLRDFTGLGCLVLPTRKKFEGEWVGGCLVGNAKIFYPNGDVYFGETYDYRRHGRGQLVSSETKYVGEFSGEDIHGYGILYDRQGQVIFEGEWKRGIRLDN